MTCTPIRMNSSVVPAPDVLRRIDVNGPRYTSYPTADRFQASFDDERYEAAMRERFGGNRRQQEVQPLSVYVHVPFCASLCYYCACNKIITHHYDRALKYLEYLEREISLQVRLIGHRAPVSQLHLGGGSPTYLRDPELDRLMRQLGKSFDILPDAELSIEVDPRTVGASRLASLAEMGFNRLSLGVQDFDPDVQTAIHRVHPEEQVAELIAVARQRGFRSINTDLIYGLPRQTEISFSKTVQRICDMRPDRIAVYAYAHLPQRFKHQRRIDEADLPDVDTRLRLRELTIRQLTQAGYQYIGMDHFALPNDPLAQAKRNGQLHRNFQGYSTQADCDLVALGVSAIGRIGPTYSQNAKTLDDYYSWIDQNRIPVVLGVRLDADDLIRRKVIMALMCDGRVEFQAYRNDHGVNFAQYFAPELDQLRTLADDGLVQFDVGGVSVTPHGWFAIRSIAMVFDARRRADQESPAYSRIV